MDNSAKQQAIKSQNSKYVLYYNVKKRLATKKSKYAKSISQIPIIAGTLF